MGAYPNFPHTVASSRTNHKSEQITSAVQAGPHLLTVDRLSQPSRLSEIPSALWYACSSHFEYHPNSLPLSGRADAHDFCR